MINYSYQGVDTAFYCVLRFGEKLVQIWCSEDLKFGAWAFMRHLAIK